MYRRNRYYDPASGQFTQEDPIGLAGGLNAYGFGGGDPINFADPFGLCPDPECIEEFLEENGPELEAAADNAVQFVEGSIDGQERMFKGAWEDIQSRAREIHSVLSEVTQRHTTTAVAHVVDGEGNSETWVASSENALRPAQRAVLKAGEKAINGAGHAEQTIVSAAKAAGRTVREIAASRPICPACADAIKAVGGLISSALK